MTDTAPRRIRRTAEPAGPTTLVAWYRIGLGAAVLAVLCALVVVGLVIGRSGDLGVVGAVLLLPAFVRALVGLGFLQRVWSDPSVVGDPQVARALRSAHTAEVAWGLGVLLALVGRLTPDQLGWLRWSAALLGLVAVGAFVGMLVLAARWRPAR